MDWLRLWHDMPNDPKWRTIARLSGESIALVISTYVHLLVDASRNVTRGHVNVTLEDIASALDVTDEQIASILKAMEGRVLAEGTILGWEKRQPKREDSGSEITGAKSSAQRKKEQRERQKPASDAPVLASKLPDVTQCHAPSRNVTTDEIRLDEIREEKNTQTPQAVTFVTSTDLPPNVTKAGAVCVVLKSEGIPSVNPSHPDLVALLTQGADVGIFSAAAQVAKKAGKHEFAYVLGIVKRQMASAAAIASTPMASPTVVQITVPGKPGVDPTLARLDADDQIARKGPSLDVLAKMAQLRNRAAA
jgi:hypothetical protein